MIDGLLTLFGPPLMNITLYGIKNCDTIKKAKKWLEEQNIEYQFHDHRIDGLDPALLTLWCEQLDWQLVLNKRGTSFRQVPAKVKDNLNQATAIALMLETPAMIKRPILMIDQAMHLGFKAETYAQIFAK